MASGEDNIRVHHRWHLRRGVEDQAPERSAVVQDPDMQADPVEYSQRQGSDAADILVVVGVKGIMNEDPEIGLRGRN